MDGGDHGDIAAAAAISAGRSAPWDVFLAPESQAAVATVAGFHRNSRLVYEHQIPSGYGNQESEVEEARMAEAATPKFARLASRSEKQNSLVAAIKG
jgi:hypothetical protein